MSIHPFPLSGEQALALVRQAAEQGEVSIPHPPGGGEWYRLVTRRQVEVCLREGDMIGDPKIDEYGNIRCSLERFGVGACPSGID